MVDRTPVSIVIPTLCGLAAVSALLKYARLWQRSP